MPNDLNDVLSAVSAAPAAPSNRFAWLADLLRQAGVPGALALPPSLGGDVDKAWSLAASHCQLTGHGVAQLVASYYRLDTWEGESPRIDVARQLPEKLCRRYQVLAVDEKDGELLVATSEPDRPELLKDLQFVVDQPVRLVVGDPLLIATQTMAVYSAAAESDTGLGVFNLDTPLLPGTAASVRLVNLMLREAIEQRASDIHVQPLMGGGEVRFRIDGVLVRMGLVPRAALQRVIGRITTVAGMDSTDKMRPDDGNARVFYQGRTYDLRLSTVPVDGQEKLVIRFLARLDATSVAGLGIAEPELGMLTHLLEHNTGLLLVTGPTGSGKTTTLYAALSEKNHIDVNIVTVEDPVEYRIPRLTQIQVNTKADLSFASALRSVLRQDPDIVLIGEIRDAETADIAVQAAMTGHLVLATLHTNDALGSIARLANLGVEPELLAEALIGATAQRLVRKLCPECAVPAHAPFSVLEQWLIDHAQVQQPLRPVGCPACKHRGFAGRTAISQVFTVNPSIAAAIAAGAQRLTLEPMAAQQGLRSLGASAVSRIAEGVTTAEEAERVLGRAVWRELAQSMGVSAPVLPSSAIPEVEQADGHGNVLLIARYQEQREALQHAISEAGYIVDAVEGALPAQDWMARNPDYGLIVVALHDLLPEPLQHLLDVRDMLSDVEAPVLLLAEDPANSIASQLRMGKNVVLDVAPHSAQQWQHVLDTMHGLAAGLGEGKA